MKRIIICIAAVSLSLSLWSQVVRQYSTQCTGVLHATVDSIDFRSDLTRVYARLKGDPHTSSRIDNIAMQVGATVLNMNDLDGVDPQRWFQWEDIPYIPVEIDFAPFKNSKAKLTFTISGPRGNSKWIATPKPHNLKK